MGQNIFLENSITQITTMLKALQRMAQKNNHREFPPKENSNKTELTRLNCVHHFMHSGCSGLVQSEVYLNKDLNVHNG